MFARKYDQYLSINDNRKSLCWGKSFSLKSSICKQSPLTLSSLLHWLSMKDGIMSEPTNIMGSDETFSLDDIFRYYRFMQIEESKTVSYLWNKMSQKFYRVSLKKTLFSGFYTSGGHATISRDVDQSKTLSNTPYWLDAIFLY